MKHILIPILNILSRAGDLLQLERTARTNRPTVRGDYGCGGRIDWNAKRPWKTIPSIWKFEIEKGLYDWLFLLFGFLKRSETHLTFYTWKSGNANAYLEYMFKRLSKQVRYGKFAEAHKTQWILMNSSSYQVSALNYVLRNWYKKLPYSTVKKVLYEVKGLVRQRATKIVFSRTYIPKPDGGVRPLGVPTLAWRIYLHMYNNTIVAWRLPTEKGRQHGYLPGKGVITAWESLFPRLESEKNIYEADYTGFFDKVSLEALDHELYRLGIPVSERMFLKRLNSSLVRLTKEDQVYEPTRRVLAHEDGSPNKDFQPDSPGVSVTFSEELQSVMLRLSNEGFKGDIIQLMDAATKELERIQREIMKPKITEDDSKLVVGGAYVVKLDPYRNHHKFRKGRGMPQGAPTSCSLSTLTLRSVERILDVLFYADDSIAFPKDGQDPVQLLENEEAGLIVNKKKSRWVKRNGVWLVDSLRFLGFEYIPGRWRKVHQIRWSVELGLMTMIDIFFFNFPILSLAFIASNRKWEYTKARFRAQTRNGATLEFTEREAFLAYLNNARTWLVNASVQQEFHGDKLEKWITKKFEDFLSLRNIAGLMFNQFKTNIETPEETRKKVKFWEQYLRDSLDTSTKLGRVSTEHDIRKVRQILKDAKDPRAGPIQLEYPHVDISGWFASRMQTDSWYLSVTQDFRLKWTSSSWIATRWSKYRGHNQLPLRALTTFTASSFACHDLLEHLRRSKSKIRRVHSAKGKRPNPRPFLKLEKFLDKGFAGRSAGD